MLGIIMRMGWMGLAALSVICFGFVGFILQSGLQSEAAKAAALQQPAPVAVALDAFDATRDVHLAQEVHVIGQINPEYNYTLTEHHNRKGPDYDVVRRMFVLFGPQDAADAKMARGVILLREDQIDAFLAYTAENAEGFTEQGFSFAINGAVDGSPELDNMANDALAKEGLTKAPDFVFIDPWLEGRAVALAPAPSVPWGAAAFPGLPALFFALMAIWRKRRGNPVAQVRAEPAAQPTQAAAMAMPPVPKKGSFLGKVVVGYVAIFVGMGMGFKLATVALPLFTLFVLMRMVKVGATAGLREVMAIGGGLKAAVSQKAAMPDVAPVAAKPVMSQPPAIRPGFSFADLIPKRMPKPVENDDAYARLAASIRSEQSRRQGV